MAKDTAACTMAKDSYTAGCERVGSGGGVGFFIGGSAGRVGLGPAESLWIVSLDSLSVAGSILKVLTHLPFHLVDLPKLEHSLSDGGPQFVGVSTVADESMTLEASMKADTNKRCPEDPRVVRNRALRR